MESHVLNERIVDLTDNFAPQTINEQLVAKLHKQISNLLADIGGLPRWEAAALMMQVAVKFASESEPKNQATSLRAIAADLCGKADELENFGLIRTTHRTKQ